MLSGLQMKDSPNNVFARLSHFHWNTNVMIYSSTTNSYQGIFSHEKGGHWTKRSWFRMKRSPLLADLLFKKTTGVISGCRKLLPGEKQITGDKQDLCSCVFWPHLGPILVSAWIHYHRDAVMLIQLYDFHCWSIWRKFLRLMIIFFFFSIFI